MIIDFREIPAGNTGGNEQDQFEFFSRDFFEDLGFKIIQHPSRGADGKKDMIIYGKFDDSKADILWLVSCKHNAHSNSALSVNDRDEINILERLEANNCKGFIGIYSTVAATSLSNLLFGLTKIESQIFDHRRIEKLIISRQELRDLFWRYFTKSFDKYKLYMSSKQFTSMNKEKMPTSKKIKVTSNSKRTISKEKPCLTEEDVLRITKTALIIIEIEKIKEKYFDANWEERENVLREFHKYSDHTNITVAELVFNFLSSAADQTRGGMTQNVTISIFSLTMDFFPYSEDTKDREKIMQLAIQCINTAFSLVYDAAIYLKDYNIIMYGLTILKYIYKKGKYEKMPELTVKVDEIYKELEQTLIRPERNDLKDALDLVLLFKADREEGTLSFPPLTETLHKIIYPTKS